MPTPTKTTIIAGTAISIMIGGAVVIMTGPADNESNLPKPTPIEVSGTDRNLNGFRSLPPILAEIPVRIIGENSTSTLKGHAFDLTVFDTEFQKQGKCFAIKDSDGDGFTYITANDGEVSYSNIACQE